MGDNIQRKTIEIISEITKIKPKNIESDGTFTIKTYMDQIDLIDMIAKIEELFDVDIDDEEIENMRTVEDLVELIRSK